MELERRESQAGSEVAQLRTLLRSLPVEAVAAEEQRAESAVSHVRTSFSLIGPQKSLQPHEQRCSASTAAQRGWGGRC